MYLLVITSNSKIKSIASSINNSKNELISILEFFYNDFVINFVENNRYGSISNIAWQGVTAMLMRNGGRTISSTFSIPREENRESKKSKKIRQLAKGKVEEMKMALNSDNLILLNINEISQVSAHCLSYVDHRLSQCMREFNKPFGGVITIMCGDFKQLPSISRSIPSCLKAMNLPSCSNEHVSVDSPLVRSVQIFLNHNVCNSKFCVYCLY